MVYNTLKITTLFVLHALLYFSWMVWFQNDFIP
jgi:hypothetical protein